MCGIRAALFCSACSDEKLLPAEPPAHVADLLRARGPQATGRSVQQHREATCVITAAVLHLRGTRVCVQPVLSRGVVLAWNGEVFGGDLVPAAGESDTASVMEAILSALSGSDPHARLTECLARVRGPFAVCVSVPGALYFARDSLGRRSLLMEPPSACGRPFVVSSVSSASSGSTAPTSCSELPPIGVFRLAFESSRDAEGPALPPSSPQVHWSLPSCRPATSWELTCMPWRTGVTPLPRVPPWLPPCPAAGAAPSADWCSEADVAAAALELLRRLGEAVRVRVQGLPVEPGARCMGCTLPRPEPGPEGCVREALRVAASRAGMRVDDYSACLPASASCCGREPLAVCGEIEGGGIARLAIPFSGGLDSMVLARLAHEYLPISEAIDLVNVCFAVDHRSPDRIAALEGLQELRHCCPGRRYTLICVDESYDSVLDASTRISQLLLPRQTHLDFNVGAAFWFVSRGVGFVDVFDSKGAIGAPGTLPMSPADRRLLRYGRPASAREAGDYHLSDFDKEHPVELGAPCVALDEIASLASPGDIAFALHGWRTPAVPPPAPLSQQGGTALPPGLDARVREYDARVAPFCSEPTTDASCLGVVTSDDGGADGEGEDVSPSPSRRPVSSGSQIHPKDAGCCGVGSSGSSCASPAHRSCAAHMCRVCCVSAASTGSASGAARCAVHRLPKSTDPRYASRPTREVLGVSGSLGAEKLAPVTRVRALVRTAARVFLSGIGADEQMAGYGRHRTAFRHGGWSGLQRELATDSGRLWIRNLGRDDRIWSDHAREVRTPFLDEDVVDLLRRLPPPMLCDLRLPPGVGDKRVLRVVGRMLGLGRAAALVKRAIHFGSRIAKQSNVSCFGSNRAARGDVKFIVGAPSPLQADASEPPGATDN